MTFEIDLTPILIGSFLLLRPYIARIGEPVMQNVFAGCSRRWSGFNDHIRANKLLWGWMVAYLTWTAVWTVIQGPNSAVNNVTFAIIAVLFWFVVTCGGLWWVVRRLK